jgi:hypothetical protein
LHVVQGEVAEDGAVEQVADQLLFGQVSEVFVAQLLLRGFEVGLQGLRLLLADALQVQRDDTRRRSGSCG